jgi:protein gp37
VKWDVGKWTVRQDRAEWVREIRDQCLATETPFFFKQWGGATPKAGGRELDGEVWDQYPVRELSQISNAAGE